MNALKNLIRDDNGASMVEYALLVALIAVVSVVILTTLGKTIAGEFTNINSDL
jgi:pilus assembly protein Flp/PilA